MLALALAQTLRVNGPPVVWRIIVRIYARGRDLNLPYIEMGEGSESPCKDKIATPLFAPDRFPVISRRRGPKRALDRHVVAPTCITCLV